MCKTLDLITSTKKKKIQALRPEFKPQYYKKRGRRRRRRKRKENVWDQWPRSLRPTTE
jgi:hypothetical protein